MKAAASSIVDDERNTINALPLTGYMMNEAIRITGREIINKERPYDNLFISPYSALNL
jgi:hypothetical protein